MRAFHLLIGSMMLMCAAVAQQAPRGTVQNAPQTTQALVARQSTELRPADLSRIMNEVYGAISGPAGQKRDPDHFRSLFVPQYARLATIHHDQSTGQDSLLVMSPDDYVQRIFPILEKSGFYEREIARRTERFGNVLHVWSTYESRHKPDEQPFARGINSFQLVNDGRGWKVFTILWDSERPGNAIPQEYLQSR